MQSIGKKQRSDEIMRKNTVKKGIGMLMASLLLTTLPSALVGAQTTPTTEDNIQLNEIILIEIKELTEKEMNLERILSEIHNMLNSIYTDIQMKEQTSMSLRGFYGNDIFSCRGFA